MYAQFNKIFKKILIEISIKISWQLEITVGHLICYQILPYCGNLC